MDQQNYLNVKKIAGQLWDPGKVRLLMDEIYPSRNIGIPDPWFGDEEDFHYVYGMLDEACNAIIEKYRQVKAVK
jgi:protein-tyrosine phosphatase